MDPIILPSDEPGLPYLIDLTALAARYPDPLYGSAFDVRTLAAWLDQMVGGASDIGDDLRDSVRRPPHDPIKPHRLIVGTCDEACNLISSW